MTVRNGSLETQGTVPPKFMFVTCVVRFYCSTVTCNKTKFISLYNYSELVASPLIKIFGYLFLHYLDPIEGLSLVVENCKIFQSMIE